MPDTSGIKRQFETGATRDTDVGKPAYVAYLSIPALRQYGAYMLQHSTMPDGTVRSGSNWKKGIPKDAYEESLFRHVLDVLDGTHGPEYKDALCAVIFNAMGLLDATLRTE